MTQNQWRHIRVAIFWKLLLNSLPDTIFAWGTIVLILECLINKEKLVYDRGPQDTSRLMPLEQYSIIFTYYFHANILISFITKDMSAF